MPSPITKSGVRVFSPSPAGCWPARFENHGPSVSKWHTSVSYSLPCTAGQSPHPWSPPSKCQGKPSPSPSLDVTTKNVSWGQTPASVPSSCRRAVVLSLQWVLSLNNRITLSFQFSGTEWGPRICIFNKFPGDADTAGSHPENHRARTTISLGCWFSALAVC